jgi:hypothetical protein
LNIETLNIETLIDDLVQTIRDVLTSVSIEAVAAGAAVLVVIFYIAYRLLRRRKSVAPVAPPVLPIDLSMMGDEGPPKGPPVLEFYHLPMRLAAVVLAPVGRVRELPPEDELPKLFDAIVPGLDRVAAVHRPLVRRWPSQLSARGFAHILFAQVQLPGDGGKGTPWSAVAGVFKVQGQPIMAGLVLRAASPNGLGQVVIDSEEKWLGCLRVKQGAD